ncbi:type I restriction endonuclease subunit M [Vibrio fluvialis]|nr:type I restriction endonuclease subunit M [Vibrio fluvialis]
MYNIFAEEIYIKHAMPFSLGRVVVTRELYNSFSSTDLTSLLQRHENCDWGNCCLDDALNNDKATKSNQRILSSYKLNGTDIWIITEHDRSVTTILYPRDY